MPHSTITLSLLAVRKENIARQITELAEYGGEKAKTAIEGAKAEQLKRLEKQAKECADCEAAETKLQAAYNASLTAHKFVEDVTDSVIKQKTAEAAYNTAFQNVAAALNVFKDAKTAFATAKATLAEKVAAYGCGEESTVEQYEPLKTKAPLSGLLILDEVAAVNAAADAVREKKGIVDTLKGIQDTKKIEWDDAIKASIATKLCNGACKQPDVDAAEAASAAKDVLVTAALGVKDTECAAIKVSLREEAALKV